MKMDENKKTSLGKLSLDYNVKAEAKGASVQRIADDDVVEADVKDHIKRCEAKQSWKFCTKEEKIHDCGANVSVVRTYTKVVNELLVWKYDSGQARNNADCGTKNSLAVVTGTKVPRTDETYSKRNLTRYASIYKVCATSHRRTKVHLTMTRRKCFSLLMMIALNMGDVLKVVQGKSSKILAGLMLLCVDQEM